MKYVVINGFPRTGKTTFTAFCLKYLGAYGTAISTVDFIKEFAKNCGWEGEKTPRDRKFLSDLKKLLADWDDVPWKKVQAHIEQFRSTFEQFDMSTDKAVVFIHSREPEEIERFKAQLGATTVLISRGARYVEELSNYSDRHINDVDYDYAIKNDGSLEELEQKAKEFCDMIRDE